MCKSNYFVSLLLLIDSVAAKATFREKERNSLRKRTNAERERERWKKEQETKWNHNVYSIKMSDKRIIVHFKRFVTFVCRWIQIYISKILFNSMSRSVKSFSEAANKCNDEWTRKKRKKWKLLIRKFFNGHCEVESDYS